MKYNAKNSTKSNWLLALVVCFSLFALETVQAARIEFDGNFFSQLTSIPEINETGMVSHASYDQVAVMSDGLIAGVYYEHIDNQRNLIAGLGAFTIGGVGSIDGKSGTITESGAGTFEVLPSGAVYVTGKVVLFNGTEDLEGWVCNLTIERLITNPDYSGPGTASGFCNTPD